jgi:hypothetical protein
MVGFAYTNHKLEFLKRQEPKCMQGAFGVEWGLKVECQNLHKLRKISGEGESSRT